MSVNRRCKCVFGSVCVFRGEAERHISSEIAMKRHAAYLDDKQHGRDLSAAKQIRQKDRGKTEGKSENNRERWVVVVGGGGWKERWLACKMKGK